MKKITSKYKLYAVLALILSVQGCSSKEEKQETKSNTEIIAEVNTVMGVGKVVPADGWTLLSANSSGIIKEIYVQEGDEVKADQALFRIVDNNNLDLNVDEAKVRLANLQAQRAVNSKDIERERLKLQELQQKYDISKRLYEKNAETLERLNSDQTAVQQQQKLIETLLSKERVDRLNEKEQEISIQKSAKNLSELVIKAPRAGIINELSAEIGQAVSNNVQLGKIVDATKLLIEAEVDELFADKIEIGQEVSFYSVGRTDSLGSGKIVYTSPTLMNKSILYESVGESEDRRVRRIKIQPNIQNKLLINAKVECQIKIK